MTICRVCQLCLADACGQPRGGMSYPHTRLPHVPVWLEAFRLGGMTILSTPAVLPDITEYRDALAVLEPATTQSEAIDRIRALEHLKATCEAAQARETAVLEKLRLEEEAARGVPKSRRGKGLAAEVALARGESPVRGAKSLKLAGALSQDLPKTMAALCAGHIREEHAHVVSTETSWLSADHRKQVDAAVADRLGGLGPRQLGAEVRAHAQRLDQAGAVKQLDRAISQRRVSVRPASDNMAYLTALLPMQEAVAVLACLQRDATTMVGTGETSDPADPTGQSRTRNQIMADTLVQRTTGQTAAPAVPAEVHVVMTDAALFGEDATPAWLSAHGPIPAATAKRWLAHPEASVFLRRVFTRPTDGQLVALESRSRDFPPGLRQMVLLRDDTCRTPFCDAPALQADHIEPVRDGGPTNHDNASGLCAACNQTKENIGWKHTGNPEQLNVSTPTGHTYTVETPPLVTGKPPDTRPPPMTARAGPIERRKRKGSYVILRVD